MRKTITLLFLLACCMVYGQKGPKIVPNWVLKTPIPGNDTYYYIMQRANGLSEREARNQAIAQAFAQADYYGGTAVNSESINEAIQEGKSFDVISRLFSIPLNIVCEFHRDNEDGTVDYYILCQIAKSGNIKPQFEPFNECSEFDISIQRMEEYKEKHAAEFKAKEREEAKRAKESEREDRRYERQKRLNGNDYVYNGRNKYVAWGVAGATYPWDLNTSIEFRYGSSVGFGMYGEVGVGFSKLNITNLSNIVDCARPDCGRHISYYDYEEDTYFSEDFEPSQGKIVTYLMYSVGLKFFPYRGLFIGCGYSSYMPFLMNIECPEDYLPDTYPFLEEVVPDYDRTYVRNTEFCEDAIRNKKVNGGMQFMLGYDFVSKMVDTNVGFYVGVKGGIIYDIKNKAIVPLAGLKLGLAFGYK